MAVARSLFYSLRQLVKEAFVVIHLHYRESPRGTAAYIHTEAWSAMYLDTHVQFLALVHEHGGKFRQLSKSMPMR